MKNGILVKTYDDTGRFKKTEQFGNLLSRIVPE